MLLSSKLISIVLEQKRGPPNEIGHSRGGASTKIHAIVDAYGYPVYFMISEGQRNDINYAIPLLDHVNPNGSNVLADRGETFGRNLFSQIESISSNCHPL